MSNTSDEAPSPKCAPKFFTASGGMWSGRPLPEIPTERRSVMEILGVNTQYLTMRTDEEPSSTSGGYGNTPM